MASGDEGKPVYIPVSEEWRKGLSPLKAPLLLYRSFQLQRAELEIFAGADSPRLPCAYIGEGLSLEYYQKLYVSSACSTPTHMPLRLLRAEISRARARFPVTLVETNRLLRSSLPAGGLVTYPWIRHLTDLAGEHYLRRRRGIERGVGQRVRKHGFQCRFTQAATDLESFYYAYDLPHIRTRHGTLAVGRSLAQLKKALRSGFLLQVWQSGRWVSGLVAERTSPERIYALAVGLHPDHLPAWQNGALAAAYYFLFRWARENGVRTVDLGGSRPHRTDGVFHHKTLLAALPERDPWHHTEIVFYLDAAVPLPTVVAEQLVWSRNRFLTIAEALATTREEPIGAAVAGSAAPQAAR